MHDPASLIRTACECLNAHDLDAYFALMTDDVVWIGLPGTFEGKEAVREGTVRTFDAIPDHWRRLERIAVSNNSVATWLIFGGTLAATGAHVEVEGCTIWDVEGECIRAIREYSAR